MMSDPIEQIVAAQTRLIAALDLRIPEDIVAATSELAAAISAFKSSEGSIIGAEALSRIDYAGRQGDAAQARVNILSDWNRQRIDRLAELRGGGPRLVYNRR